MKDNPTIRLGVWDKYCSGVLGGFGTALLASAFGAGGGGAIAAAPAAAAAGVGAATGVAAGTAAGVGVGAGVTAATAASLLGSAATTAAALRTPPKVPPGASPPQAPTMSQGLLGGTNRSLASFAPALALGGTQGSIGASPAPSLGQKTLLGQ